MRQSRTSGSVGGRQGNLPVYPTPHIAALIKAAVEEAVAPLRARIVELELENAELKARLNQNSSNFSRPPSSDGPKKPPPKGGKGERKQGAQPGHKGVTRATVPPDKVTARTEHRPDRCEGCDALLDGVPTAGSPEIRQVVEIPNCVASQALLPATVPGHLPSPATEGSR